MAKKNNSTEQTPKKKFTTHDMIRINPLTKNQKVLFDTWNQYPDLNFFLCGSAGTGKTFLSIYNALYDVLSENTPYEKLIIVRSSVVSREIGYLPGNLEEKVSLYEIPYITTCDEIFKYSKSYENLKKLGYIEFHSTSYLRGQTFNNAIIVVDEMQNMGMHELHTIMTRVGKNSKIIFSGDIAQNDLIQKRNDISGFNDFYEIIVNMREHFELIEFNVDDICRSELIKAYITIKEKLNK